MQIHWPGFPFANNWSTNKFVDGLARVKIAGLTKAVGVSNFKADRVREAANILKVRGNFCETKSLIKEVYRGVMRLQLKLQLWSAAVPQFALI